MVVAGDWASLIPHASKVSQLVYSGKADEELAGFLEDAGYDTANLAGQWHVIHGGKTLPMREAIKKRIVRIPVI